jgi:hypothetical protein
MAATAVTIITGRSPSDCAFGLIAVQWRDADLSEASARSQTGRDFVFSLAQSSGPPDKTAASATGRSLALRVKSRGARPEVADAMTVRPT